MTDDRLHRGDVINMNKPPYGETATRRYGDAAIRRVLAPKDRNEPRSILESHMSHKSHWSHWSHPLLHPERAAHTDAPKRRNAHSPICRFALSPIRPYAGSPYRRVAPRPIPGVLRLRAVVQDSSNFGRQAARSWSLPVFPLAPAR
jgi:hypothetical protein